MLLSSFFMLTSTSIFHCDISNSRTKPAVLENGYDTKEFYEGATRRSQKLFRPVVLSSGIVKKIAVICSIFSEQRTMKFFENSDIPSEKQTTLPITNH